MQHRPQPKKTLRCPATLWGSLFAAALLAPLLCGCDGKDDSPAAPAATALPEWSEAEQPVGGNALRHAAALCAMGPRPSGSPAYAEQLGYLETRLTAAGWAVQRDSFTAPNGTPMVNLRAVFGDSSEPRPLLVSCHIDTKRLTNFIGADDGASAAAVMLELARVLALHPELAARVEFIFLDGEEAFAARMTDEDGLYGSRFDAERRANTDTLPRYQINLDMVGGADNTIAVPAYDTSDFMLAQYAQAVMAENLSSARWTYAPASYRDDHRPYLDYGVDSLNLIADFRGSNWWHKSGDTFERLSARTMGEAARLTLRLLQRLTENNGR